MSEKDPIIKEAKVKYSGVYDMPLLYKKLIEWIKLIKFKDPKEEKYVERVKPFGKIIDLVWKAQKDDLDGYVKMELEVKFLIVGLTEVELDRPSGKVKLNKADLEVTFSSSVVRNNKNEWADGSLFKKIYEKYIVREQIERIKINLYNDTEKIIDETKNFLALYRFK